MSGPLEPVVVRFVEVFDPPGEGALPGPLDLDAAGRAVDELAPLWAELPPGRRGELERAMLGPLQRVVEQNALAGYPPGRSRAIVGLLDRLEAHGMAGGLGDLYAVDRYWPHLSEILTAGVVGLSVLGTLGLAVGGAGWWSLLTFPVLLAVARLVAFGVDVSSFVRSRAMRRRTRAAARRAAG